ncbi:MAG: hypothetical protein V1833_03720 [Elusimicrobiota bacterium]
MKKTNITFYFLLSTSCLHAGISTTFIDVVLENLQIGESYNLRTLKNCPMIITNNGQQTIDVVLEVDEPGKKLKPEYEQIINAEWIKVVPNRYRLGPYEKGSSDVIITIPNDSKLMGRHFQAYISASAISYPAPAGAFTTSTGTRTRIRFSVGTMGPKYLKEEKKRKKMMTLDFELTPVNINIKEPVELGKKIDIRKERGIGLHLINRATESVMLNMNISADKVVLGNTGEYAIGDTNFLEIKPKKLTLRGESIKKLYLYIKIPNEEKYRNKKFVFVIKAEVPGDVPVEVFSKLYVTTAP